MILFAVLLFLAAQETPRAWLASDPLVQFEGDARIRPLMPEGRSPGLYQVVVACDVQADYSLSACRSVRVTPADSGLQDDGPRAVGRIRLRETPDGPRPGDSLLFDIRVETSRRASDRR